MKALPGRDFSTLVVEPEKAGVQAVRPGVLFNYMGVSTVDANYLREALAAPYLGQARPPLSQAKLDKRGLLSFAFDGRYKFSRYYSPTAFNTPKTLRRFSRTTTFSSLISKLILMKFTTSRSNRKRTARRSCG